MADTELWLVDLDKAGAALEALEAATPRMSDDTLRQLDAIRDTAVRGERRLSHIALRILLERRIGTAARCQPFGRNASGKPVLATGGTAFSLAHTHGLALIALGVDGPLGVDIECMRTVRMAEARRAPIEVEAVALAAGRPLSSTGRDARFLNAWVRIEAAAKAHGDGVGRLLERLRPGRARPLATAGEFAAAPQIVVHDIDVPPGAVAAVAMAAGREPPPLVVLPATVAGIEALLQGSEGTKR